jgi:hypothetical protein
MPNILARTFNQPRGEEKYRLDATAQRRDHEFKCRMIAADRRMVWLQDIASVKIEADWAVWLRGS